MKRARQPIRPVLALVLLSAAAGVGGCTNLAKENYFLPGGVDQTSAVAGQVAAAQQAPGPFPRFSQIPPAPTDVRPLTAWRAAIGETLAEKRSVDANNSTYPYTLSNTQAFAEASRARIPPAEATPPAVDATQAAEAYAASQRERAKAPPPPK